MPSLAHLNQLDRPAFAAALGHLFEHSPWVAETAWPERPFRDAAHLHSALCAAMRAAPMDKQLALIRAHPDLAGRLAQQNRLTAESTREQASAGLDRLSDDALAVFQTNNAAYLARFGFPFIICARLNNRATILAAMQARLNHSLEAEFATALDEIEKIAQLRLNDLLQAN
ncbi:MAG: 2-oxo-4-hydroxy-4-carboxy-5-ureidoimidazoline decarboxylase [Verrucomicrobia bacterium]|nr:2-oxo-4-hydroxy-4-carboxy-5-ureidoimidazoline decarboxylase [Verrucomicrobiota bacterium]